MRLDSGNTSGTLASMTPGKRLRRWLKSQNVTQAELAERLGCGKSFVCALCAGRKRPSLTLAIRLERLTLGAVRCVDWGRDEDSEAAGEAA